MATKPDERYIDLLKNTLTFTLWPEPPIPILAFNSQRQIHQRIINNILASLFKIFGLQIVKDRNFSEKERTDGQIWPGYADTMIGVKRLDNIKHCIEQVLENGIEGDFIETGVWRGGACIFMRGLLATYGIENRRVFVADSFRGLPKPDAKKYPADNKDRHHAQDFLAVSQEEVENNFRKYGLLDDRVVLFNGWF
jgi:O-methyltransferase